MICIPCAFICHGMENVGAPGKLWFRNRAARVFLPLYPVTTEETYFETPPVRPAGLYVAALSPRPCGNPAVQDVLQRGPREPGKQPAAGRKRALGLPHGAGDPGRLCRGRHGSALRDGERTVAGGRGAGAVGRRLDGGQDALRRQRSGRAAPDYRRKRRRFALAGRPLVRRFAAAAELRRVGRGPHSLRHAHSGRGRAPVGAGFAVERGQQPHQRPFRAHLPRHHLYH